MIIGVVDDVCYILYCNEQEGSTISLDQLDGFLDSFSLSCSQSSHDERLIMLESFLTFRPYLPLGICFEFVITYVLSVKPLRNDIYSQCLTLCSVWF